MQWARELISVSIALSSRALFTFYSFQNIISRCIATIRIFFPCLFCFIVLPLLHNLSCFHVSFFILLDFFSFVLYFIQRQPNLIYLVSLKCMSFVLLWWISFPLHSVHHYFIRAHVHTCTGDIMMWTKCEIRNCGNASDRIWLINAEKCAKILEISCISMIIGWMQWIELILYFHYSTCLVKDHSICSCTVKKANGFQTLINYVVKVESRKNGANFIEIKIILDLL